MLRFIPFASVIVDWIFPRKTDPRSDVCCCCCVESLEIKNIIELYTGTEYGHSFSIVAKLRYTSSKKSNEDCELKWFEKSNRIPPFLYIRGAISNHWYDAMKIMPESPVFAGWRNRAQKCPSYEDVKITDPPIASLSMPERITYWRITIESGKNCPCRNTSLTVKAKQTLIPDGKGKGGVTTQDFEIIED